MSNFFILDRNGIYQPWSFVTKTYGAVVIRKELVDTGAERWKVIGLKERVGPAVLDAEIVNASNQPLKGIRVARRWPYKEDNPELPLLPEEFHGWFNRGIYGPTNELGHVGYAVGGGDMYDPMHQAGASTIWVEGNSEAIEGMGILRSPGYPHLTPVFQWSLDEPPEPPEPGECLDPEELLVHVDAALNGLMSAVQALKVLRDILLAALEPPPP